MAKQIRLGLTNISHTKPPFLEWTMQGWRVWTAYNSTLTSGTYTWLKADGTMIRETLQNGIPMESVLVK